VSSELSTEAYSYRPPLDGLRAVAVLAVISYHFGYSWLPGGFLGVDLFFVLSGYLITRLLLIEFEGTRRVALVEFWARRVRRLLPALLLLIVAASLWVYNQAPVETWLARRQDMLWTLFYRANWHFIDTSQNYFAQYAGASPLLHTWSLAIEEQFYLLWPLVFLLLARTLRGRRWPMVSVLIVATLASAVRMHQLYGSAGVSRAYYGTDSRAQQLLVGAALATIPIWTTRRTRAPRPAAYLGGLVAACAACFAVLLSDRSAFYYQGGALTFAVIVALVIWAVEVAPASPLGRALTLRPLPWIGRISYGLYLWHWFILVALLRVQRSHPAVHWPPIAWLLTFGAATVSYYLVELPIRQGRVSWVKRSPRRLALAAGAAVGATALVVLQATTVSDFVPRRVNAEPAATSTTTPTAATVVAPTTSIDVQHLDMDLASALADTSDLECPKTAPDVTFDWCIRNAGSAQRPVLATIGDSMARALRPGLESEASKRNFTFVQAAWGGCTISATALAQYEPASLTPYDLKCRDEALATVEAMIDSNHPNVLIMTEHGSAISQLRADDRWIPAPSDEHDQRLFEGYVAVFDQLVRRVDHLVLVETNQDGQLVGCVASDSNNDPDCVSPPATVCVTVTSVIAM